MDSCWLLQVAAALTPWLCGAIGWRAVPWGYGGCIAVYGALWLGTTAR